MTTGFALAQATNLQCAPLCIVGDLREMGTVHSGVTHGGPMDYAIVHVSSIQPYSF